MKKVVSIVILAFVVMSVSCSLYNAKIPRKKIETVEEYWKAMAQYQDEAVKIFEEIQKEKCVTDTQVSQLREIQEEVDACNEVARNSNFYEYVIDYVDEGFGLNAIVELKKDEEYSSEIRGITYSDGKFILSEDAWSCACFLQNMQGTPVIAEKNDIQQYIGEPKEYEIIDEDEEAYLLMDCLVTERSLYIISK